MNTKKNIFGAGMTKLLMMAIVLMVAGVSSAFQLEPFEGGSQREAHQQIEQVSRNYNPDEPAALPKPMALPEPMALLVSLKGKTGRNFTLKFTRGLEETAKECILDVVPSNQTMILKSGETAPLLQIALKPLGETSQQTMAGYYDHSALNRAFYVGYPEALNSNKGTYMSSTTEKESDLICEKGISTSYLRVQNKSKSVEVTIEKITTCKIGGELNNLKSQTSCIFEK